MANTLKLITPEAKYLQSYLASLVEDKDEKAKADFEKRLVGSEGSIEKLAKAMQLGGGEIRVDNGQIYQRVPEYWYWLVDDNEYIGSLRIRTELNEFLKEYGGHVGYDVRGSQRRKGYATQMLALGIPYLKELGLEKVFITCDESNTASRKVIESNGGVLQDVVKLDYRPVETRRYWLKV